MLRSNVNEAESTDATAAVVDLVTVATQAIRQAANDQVRINANLSVRSYYQQIERSREDYVELIENVHPDALLGYVASVRINVTVLAPERTDAVRGAALAAGPTSAGAVRFSLEPTVENQRTAFSAALVDAHARARAAAELSGAQLGKLLLVQEGQGPCVGFPSTRVGIAQPYRHLQYRLRLLQPSWREPLAPRPYRKSTTRQSVMHSPQIPALNA